jgi:hypothetical protein
MPTLATLWQVSARGKIHPAAAAEAARDSPRKPLITLCVRRWPLCRTGRARGGGGRYLSRSKI